MELQRLQATIPAKVAVSGAPGSTTAKGIYWELGSRFGPDGGLGQGWQGTVSSRHFLLAAIRLSPLQDLISFPPVASAGAGFSGAGRGGISQDWSAVRRCQPSPAQTTLPERRGTYPPRRRSRPVPTAARIGLP